MRATDIVKSVDKRIRPQTEELAEQVLFMARKLAEAREQLEEQNLMITYDNGGGQSGVRENPLFTAYEKLLASFNKSIVTLRDLIGEDESEELSSLESFRDKVRLVVR